MAMTNEEMIEVIKAASEGESIQAMYHGSSEWFDIDPIINRFNFVALDYRVKSKAPIPDTMDWSNVHPDFRFVARDENGSVYLYETKPEIWGVSMWATEEANYERIGDAWFTGHTVGNVDWKESLIERGEYE